MGFFNLEDNVEGCDKHESYNPMCTQCTINKTIVDDEIKKNSDDDKES